MEMDKTEYLDYERLMFAMMNNQHGIGDTKKLAQLCFDIVECTVECGAQTIAENLCMDQHFVERIRSVGSDQPYVGLICGIMYERKYIAAQLRKQGIVLVGLNH